MNTFEAARLTHDRVNGGDENKFPVTLAIVTEIILLCKIRLSLVESAISVISSGAVDGHVMFFIGELDDESELKMMENVQNFFAPRLRLARNINSIIRKLKMIGFLGLALIVLRLIS